MEWFTAWNSWLIGGFLLLILEVFISGVFLMWWGLAGIIMAGLVTLVTLSLSWQFAIWAIIASIFSLLWWRYQKSKDQKDETNMLNQKDLAMLGKQGKVIEILDNGSIRAKFADSTWKVEGEHLAIGDLVKVVKVKAITLIVEKI
ncbi:MAG: hypothetical protein CR960_00140 [Pasteurellales bacterium]|nr:MAG: hypothetical protein CR960_00140 [Pasteurellales bacterium]